MKPASSGLGDLGEVFGLELKGEEERRQKREEKALDYRISLSTI